MIQSIIAITIPPGRDCTYIARGYAPEEKISITERTPRDVGSWRAMTRIIQDNGTCLAIGICQNRA